MDITLRMLLLKCQLVPAMMFCLLERDGMSVLLDVTARIRPDAHQRQADGLELIARTTSTTMSGRTVSPSRETANADAGSITHILAFVLNYNDPDQQSPVIVTSASPTRSTCYGPAEDISLFGFFTFPIIVIWRRLKRTFGASASVLQSELDSEHTAV